jgi:3-methyladenine DNA glycosylase AlkD
MQHEVHEVRLTSFMLLVYKYNKAKTQEAKREIVDFYMKNIAGANNWDIVDSSAHYILGDYVCKFEDKALIDKLVTYSSSKNLWLRRISIMFTFAFIKAGQFDLTLKQAEKLLHDKEDLIHKAVGWMLREVGNRNRKLEESFLGKHYNEMPRTMLRYAIEKFDETSKQFYMKR